MVHNFLGNRYVVAKCDKNGFSTGHEKIARAFERIVGANQSFLPSQRLELVARLRRTSLADVQSIYSAARMVGLIVSKNGQNPPNF